MHHDTTASIQLLGNIHVIMDYTKMLVSMVTFRDTLKVKCDD
jgi:hypothetical protein